MDRTLAMKTRGHHTQGSIERDLYSLPAHATHLARILSLSILSQNYRPRVPTARCYVQPRSYIEPEDS